MVAYLTLGELVGVPDVEGVKVLMAFKGIESIKPNKICLKDALAIYAFSLGGAITSLISRATEKLD